MQTLPIDPRILRTLVGPDIKVVPGRAMMARVVANPGGRGTLSIAGYLLEAELPEAMQAGQELRLVVRDVSPERVLLSLSEDHAAPADPAPPPAPAHAAATAAPGVAVPLPGGATLQVTEREAETGAAGSPPTHTLAVRYDAPALGAMDLRLALHPGSLRVTVTVSRGAPLDLAQAGGDELRQALGETLGRPVSVTVSARHEPLDVYA